MFSKLSFKELAVAGQTDGSNADVLLTEAVSRAQNFLDETLVFDVDDSPFFLTMLKTFETNADPDQYKILKKAEAKLTPILKEFDDLNGSTYAAPVSRQDVARNLADLEIYEKIDPAIRPELGQIFRLLDDTAVSDDDGTVLQDFDLKEDILETAKAKTYLRLCLNLDKISPELYFSVLRAEMESLLFSLFLAEQSQTALTPEKTEEIRAEFMKLLDAVD